MSVRLAGPHTPHVPMPPFRLRLLRREGGSDLLPDEYATLDAAARAVPVGGVADVVDAEGFHVALVLSNRDSVHVVLPRLDGLGQPARVIVESGGLASIMGKWPGDETEEEVRRALEELS